MGIILFIESTAVIREPLAELLRQRGHEVVAIGDESEARGALSTLSPDLILFDPFNDGSNGAALLGCLREAAAAQGVPIIAFSVSARREDVLSAIGAGVTDYVLKATFSLSRFLQRLDTALHRQKQATEPQAEAADEAEKQAKAPMAQAAPVEEARDPVEIIKDLKPIVSRTEISDAIDACGELKALSPTVGEVLKLTQSPKCSTEALAKAIKRDHAIALKILKLANSSVYTRGEPVDSVLKAVVRIGLGQIRQAVMNIAVIDNFASKESEGGLQSAPFWEHAIGTGLITSAIAQDQNSGAADAAFTLGLVHDVGRTVLAQQLEGAYEEVLTTSQRLRVPLDQVEKRMLLFNHADVMDRILRAWNFPRELINPVAMHHLSAGNIRKHCPAQANESMALALANRLAHAMMIGSSGNDTISGTEDFCEALNLRADLIARIVQDTRDQTDEIKFSLLSTSDTGNWADNREEHRRALAEQFRPIYLSETPEYDAFRIFTEQLVDNVVEDKPNIAVVHVRVARQVSTLSRKLQSAEEKNEVGPLPVLILSPAGKFKLEASVLESRPHRVIATPFVINRFIEATNELIADAATPAHAAAA